MSHAWVCQESERKDAEIAEILDRMLATLKGELQRLVSRPPSSPTPPPWEPPECVMQAVRELLTNVTAPEARTFAAASALTAVRAYRDWLMARLGPTEEEMVGVYNDHARHPKPEVNWHKASLLAVSDLVRERLLD